MQTTIRVSALSLVLLTLLGCAAPPAKKDPRDPWERMNRTTYKLNDKVDKAVLRPVARGYQKVTPQFVRGVRNPIANTPNRLGPCRIALKAGDHMHMQLRDNVSEHRDV